MPAGQRSGLPRRTARPAAAGSRAGATTPVSGPQPHYVRACRHARAKPSGRCGPVTDTAGRTLRADGEPVPGLYGVGNCVAQPSEEAHPTPQHGVSAGCAVAEARSPAGRMTSLSPCSEAGGR
ncbi:FAD-binding protein [Streptomyces sp. NBC_00083]|uniref:FAD-binding protein n=1 Tax=Streptomyces sp. NBC_00083 TaxID=2975647 RepID=UPI00338F5944